MKFPAKVPDGIRIYAVGDIHGRHDLLQPLLARIEAHMSRYPALWPYLVFPGDYVDCGTFSRQVVDQLISLNGRQEVVFLKGNHEHYLIEFTKNPPFLAYWLQYGGFDTLRSYGVIPTKSSDPREQELLAMSLCLILHENGHLEFLRNLEASFTCGDFFFAHAGVRPGVPLDQQNERDLREIRNDFLMHDASFGKIVVHGHTPVLEPDVRSNRINIDTGAFATGQLSCLVLERDEIEFI